MKTFKQAEEKRLKLIQLKKLGPEFSEKLHSKTIYISRALSSVISKALNSFHLMQNKVCYSILTIQY
jgi:hypothetical protein